MHSCAISTTNTVTFIPCCSNQNCNLFYFRIKEMGKQLPRCAVINLNIVKHKAGTKCWVTDVGKAQLCPVSRPGRARVSMLLMVLIPSVIYGSLMWGGDAIRDVDVCCWKVDVSNALGQNLSE